MTQALVIQTAYLGDVILTTPLLEALARTHGPVDVVTAPAASPLLETHPAVNSVLPLNKRGPSWGLSDTVRLANKLKENSYEIAYLPHRSIRSALLAVRAGIQRRVGFADSPAKLLYTETRKPRGAHELERLLSLSGETGAARPTIALTARDRRRAGEALTRAGIGKGESFVAVAPGSAWATKRWPYYGRLVEELTASTKVVAIGDLRDRGMCGNPAVQGFADLAGQLSIREAAAVLATAMLAVTNDSAPMHLAQAVGTPVVAIFGPTSPKLGFAPTGLWDRVVQLSALSCRPCSHHGNRLCPLITHSCMRRLPTDDVLQAVRQVASASRKKARCAI